MRTDIANCTEPTFNELAQLADALWDEGRYDAAARIYLQAAGQARKWRMWAHEATALHFAWKAQEHAAQAAA